MFATERFEQYILGKDPVTILTDHKPLVTILTSPERLQRMQLRLQKFSLDLQCKPGPKMHISDTLSRTSLPLTDDKASSADYQIFQVREQQSFQEELEEIDMEEHSSLRTVDLRKFDTQQEMIPLSKR